MDWFRILVGFVFLMLWVIASVYIANFTTNWYKKTELHRKLAGWKDEKLDSFAFKYLSEDIWAYICFFSYFAFAMMFVYAYSFGFVGLILMGVAYILGL